MSTYLFRDQRLPRVRAALDLLNTQVAALGDELAALRDDPNTDPAALAAKEQEFNALIERFDRIQREWNVLNAKDWRTTDRSVRLAGGDWLWRNAGPLLDEVEQDPVSMTLGDAPVTAPTDAAAVQALARGAGEPPRDWLEQVRAALNDNETAMTELLLTGFRVWLESDAASHPYLYDDVGVLLPLRLETLFEPPPEGESEWTLLLRVYPDEASIRRDNLKVSRGEHDSLLLFWNAINQSPAPYTEWLQGERAQVEWGVLAARVGAARAAWLVSTFPPVMDGDTLRLDIPNENRYAPDLPEAEQVIPNRVSGLPPTLEVWAVTDDAVTVEPPSPVGLLEPRDLSALDLPLPSHIASVKASWWASWDKAQEVGMGTVIRLPEGVTPETIRALYVAGIGDEPPDAHFQAQVDAGELGILSLGAPTNTVQGEPAADLATRAADWFEVAVHRIYERLDPSDKRSGVRGEIARALFGDAAGLSFVPGAQSFADTNTSQHMVQALYPALWGHWLHDIWQGQADAERAALWAMHHLAPEGPLMPIRIGAQPYGLVPVTALSRWQVGMPTLDDPSQRDVEQRMAEQLADLRGMLARRARAHGTVVGTDTRGLVEFLSRDASSGAFLTRQFLPVDFVSALLGLTGPQRAEFQERLKQFYRELEGRMGRSPTDYHVAAGHVARNSLPLVKPHHMIYRDKEQESDPARVPLVELIEKLIARWQLEDFYSRENMDAQYRRPFVLPDSLFVRLLVYAVQVGMQWQSVPLSPVARRVLERHQELALMLAHWLDRDEWIVQDREPGTGKPLFRLDKMPDAECRALERAFRSTLDTASHRIDPWVTGFAWQRLKQTGDSPRHNHRLGAYGWVDGPFLGKPGPTDARRLHAPSHTQALASLVLRDQFLSSARRLASPEDSIWQMNIDSRKARLAEELADEVRLGFNIHEIVGRRVENVLARHQQVKELRTNPKYAMHPDRLDPNEMCDGIRALKGLLKGGDPEAILSVAELSLAEEQLESPAGDSDFPLSPDQRHALKLVHLALDTYADLCLMDGVWQVVNRQMDRAAETMDAAAGFTRPPTFDFIRTPPSGYQLETRVLSVLPFVAVEDLPAETSPCRIAEPSLLAFIEQKLGTQWAWRIVQTAEPHAELGVVKLDELGLTPADALALSSDFLMEAARRKAALPGSVQVRPPVEYRLARELAVGLGARAAVGPDLAPNMDAQQQTDQVIRADLITRLTRLYNACVQLLQQLDTASAGVDDAARTAALRQALSWGIVIASEPQDQDALYAAWLGTPVPPGATELRALMQRARSALLARLSEALGELVAHVRNTDVKKELEAQIKNLPPLTNLVALDQISPVALTRALATLATPDGKLSIFASWSKEQLLTNTNLNIEQLQTTLDDEWLTLLAPVRPPLARLEALQLEAHVRNVLTPFEAWTSSPGDPWRTGAEAAIRANIKKRAVSSPLEFDLTPFVAAYGTADAWAMDKVAVGLLDAFGEAIPMKERTTTVAFGFNAPAARAPQAILLAVPPVPRQRLDNAGVLQIVAETRELAHARALWTENVGDLDLLARTMWLQGSGPARVHLEPGAFST